MYLKKFFCFALILTILATASPVYAKSKIQSFFDLFLGALVNVVEEIIPPAPLPEKVEEQAEEEFVNPQEVKQVLRELKDIKRELNKFAKQLAKLPNSSDDLNAINSLLEQTSNFQAIINSGENLRDTIQEFRDAQMWDEINKFRAKVEIPKEMKQWNKEIKRIGKLLTQKKTKNAASEFGLDLEGAKAKVEELKSGLAKVQEYYNGGDLESAIEEFDELRQDLQPWDISNVLQRFQELITGFKKVKDQEIKNQVKETLSETVSAFNDADYQFARELMDESFSELMQLIYKVSAKKYNKEGMLNTMQQLEIKMKEKSEEKMQKEEIKTKTELAPESQSQPAPQSAPVESVPQPPPTTP